MLIGSPARHAPGASGVRMRGFSLIELMFAVLLLGVLTALAVPTFNGYVRNAQVRAATGSIENGLKLARVEAMRRSRTVVFYLTNAAPAAGVDATANGVNWVIETVPRVGGEAAEFVQGGRWRDSAPLAGVTGPAAVCFGALGSPLSNFTALAGRGINCNTATLPVFDISATGGDRPLRVLVNASGQARWCDPVRALSSTNPDGC